ncbi:MAG: hypothetical protein ABI867_23120 [Kofleriaceae bacterium]
MRGLLLGPMLGTMLGTILLLGCAKNITSDVEDMADRACACATTKDKVCGKAVLTDFIKLAEDSRNVKGDEQRAAAAAKRIGECLLKAGVTSLEIAEGVNKIPKTPAPPAAPPAEAPGSGSN